MSRAVVSKNKVVAISYTLYNQQGEMVEYLDVPVYYVHGGISDLFIPIEQALEGRQVGDQVEVVLTPSQGFGEYNPALTFTDDLDNVPPEVRELGKQIEAQNAKGETMKFIVTDIDTENRKLTVDANHPLAGQTLRFKITVREIRDATPEELRHGIGNHFGAPLH